MKHDFARNCKRGVDRRQAVSSKVNPASPPDAAFAPVSAWGRERRARCPSAGIQRRREDATLALRSGVGFAPCISGHLLTVRRASCESHVRLHAFHAVERSIMSGYLRHAVSEKFEKMSGIKQGQCVAADPKSEKLLFF